MHKFCPSLQSLQVPQHNSTNIIRRALRQRQVNQRLRSLLCRGSGLLFYFFFCAVLGFFVILRGLLIFDRVLLHKDNLRQILNHLEKSKNKTDLLE